MFLLKIGQNENFIMQSGYRQPETVFVPQMFVPENWRHGNALAVSFYSNSCTLYRMTRKPTRKEGQYRDSPENECFHNFGNMVCDLTIFTGFSFVKFLSKIGLI